MRLIPALVLTVSLALTVFYHSLLTVTNNGLAANEHFPTSQILLNGIRNETIIEQKQQYTNTKKPDFPSSVYPDKLFTVVGLESSGTCFLAETIRNALRLSMIGNIETEEPIGEGYSNHYLDDKTYRFTEVQHVSLPFGVFCSEKRVNIIPVVFPGICTKTLREHAHLSAIRNSAVLKQDAHRSQPLTGLQIPANPFENHDINNKVFGRYRIPNSNRADMLQQCKNSIGSNFTYPTRYLLNITSHLQLYESQGVDARVVIIMRDMSISRRARYRHCSNNDLLLQEEEIGKKIIQETVEKYIGAPYWTNDNPPNRRKLMETSSDGKVILVSYELLNQLQFGYLSLIYKKLGIDSMFSPLFKDGNEKHLKEGMPTKP